VKLEWEQEAINALCGIVGGWAIELATFFGCVDVPNLSVLFTYCAIADRPDIE
jgi:hypothetical protein